MINIQMQKTFCLEFVYFTEAKILNIGGNLSELSDRERSIANGVFKANG